MFDVETATLLQSAPDLPALDANQIPQLLTRHYAELVSTRLRGSDAELETAAEQWSLEKMADAYEMIASVEKDPNLRRAAAFVAGTAQQIISRKNLILNDEELPLLDRNGVDSAIAAALLFLAAEQYADANEAGNAIVRTPNYYELTILCEHIKDLARGRLVSILDRSKRWRRDGPVKGTIQTRALKALASTLSEGIELLAASIMAEPEITFKTFDSALDAFKKVRELSANLMDANTEELGGNLHTTYAGPAHLAALLIGASTVLEQAALTRLPAPEGANEDFWNNWLRYRAQQTPFIWPNHRIAIQEEFYQTGKSAVLVLPTGAGKTTVSALKIAGTLARGKKVIFLSPTHALVEQLTEDLREIFPEDQFGLGVSSDFDMLLLDDTQLQDIEVMTPERCLAMLSFAGDSFANVGLLVFDECHLLSPQSGKIGRALDGMLCLLAFNTQAPDADMLFLSAMLDNGSEFAEWISGFTNRPCVSVDLLWKPSRQARGVVVYEKAEIDSSIRRVRATQRELNTSTGKTAKGLRKAAERELTATPHVIWGLQHNWMASQNSHAVTKILDHKLQLGAGFNGEDIWPTPSANKVAGSIALNAVSAELKTIIFVNKKSDAISTARAIAEELDYVTVLNEAEKALWDALVIELGDAKHSIFGGNNFSAVPHNASMLRLERSLAEKLFRRSDGAQVIVATPTLAQGLNLPAHLAILAGDKRMGDNEGEREDLEVHELLNAAARAGRAGHLANGIVILIPEPVIKFSPNLALTEQLKSKLASVLPEHDRCVKITDPLEVVLDRIMDGNLDDREVKYTLNRFAVIAATEGELNPQSNLMSRSFGAFLAKKARTEESYQAKVSRLWLEVGGIVDGEPHQSVVLLASQSGLPLAILERLRTRLAASQESLPISVEEWVIWTLTWLSEDEESREHLFQDVRESMLKAIGKPTKSVVSPTMVLALIPGMTAWLTGMPLNEIERELGGDPNSSSDTERMCPRARELISSFIPRGLSFVIGIVSRMVEETELLLNEDDDLNAMTVQGLSSAVRRGFDSIAKLDYAKEHKEILSRVQIHAAYNQSLPSIDFDFDDLL